MARLVCIRHVDCAVRQVHRLHVVVRVHRGVQLVIAQLALRLAELLRPRVLIQHVHLGRGPVRLTHVQWNDALLYGACSTGALFIRQVEQTAVPRRCRRHQVLHLLELLLPLLMLLMDERGAA